MTKTSDMLKFVNENKKNYKDDTLKITGNSVTISQRLDNGKTLTFPTLEDSPMFDMVKNFSERAIMPRGVSGFYSALMFSSVVCARYFNFNSNYSTLFGCLFGDTGSGKNSVKSILEKWANDVRLSCLVSEYGGVTSAAGLQALAATNPQTILTYDELGAMLQRAAGDNILKSGIVKMREMYTDVDGVLKAASYADGKNNSGKTKDVYRPAVSICGMGNPEELAGLAEGFAGGETGRFLFFQMSNGLCQNTHVSNNPLPIRCIKRIQEILSYGMGDIVKDEVDASEIITYKPKDEENFKSTEKDDLEKPIICNFEDCDVLTAWIYKYQMDMDTARKNKDYVRERLLVRTLEKAMRISIIWALMGKPYDELQTIEEIKKDGLFISNEDLETGINIVEASNEVILQHCSRIQYEEHIIAKAESIVKFLKKSKHPISRHDITESGNIKISSKYWSLVDSCLSDMGIIRNTIPNSNHYLYTFEDIKATPKSDKSADLPALEG